MLLHDELEVVPLGREKPEEVRGMHFSCLLLPEMRRPSGPKEEEVRFPEVSMVPFCFGFRR